MSRSQNPHSRAYLRHQRRRSLLRRWRRWRLRWFPGVQPPKSIEQLDAWQVRRLHRFARTPILCPCHLCRHCNPRRRYGEETLREAWADIKLWEELLDAETPDLMPRRRFSFPQGLTRQLSRSRRWRQRDDERGAGESLG